MSDNSSPVPPAAQKRGSRSHIYCALGGDKPHRVVSKDRLHATKEFVSLLEEKNLPIRCMEGAIICKKCRSWAYTAKPVSIDTVHNHLHLNIPFCHNLYISFNKNKI